MARNTDRNQTEGSQEQSQSVPSDDIMNRQGSMDERDVAQRAYRRYEARGFEDGHDMADWLEAEREAREERPTKTGGSE
jgi:hypothetical protein